jgi:hypothetical protein
MEAKEKYILSEVFADNGEHSHWTLIESMTGIKVWSEDPEECRAQGHPVKLEANKEVSEEVKGPCMQAIELLEKHGFVVLAKDDYDESETTSLREELERVERYKEALEDIRDNCYSLKPGEIKYKAESALQSGDKEK